MKRNKWVWWLLVIPFVLPLWIRSKATLQNYVPPEVTYSNHDIGRFKNVASGERAAVKKMLLLIQSGVDEDKVRVRWHCNRARPELGIDLVTLEYERDKKRFVKYDEVGTKEHPWRSIVTQYTHVEPSAIRRVAAQNGVASDLLKYGAKLKRHGPIDRDADGKLVLQW